MTGVGAESPSSSPSGFVRRDLRRIVVPTSGGASVYFVPVELGGRRSPGRARRSAASTRVQVIVAVPVHVAVVAGQRRAVDGRAGDRRRRRVDAAAPSGRRRVSRADEACVEPTALVAVTPTRIVEPTSAAVERVGRAGRAGDVDAGGGRRRCSAPTGTRSRSASCRSTCPCWRAVSVWPSRAVPSSSGATVFDGTRRPSITGVSADVTTAVPSGFVARDLDARSSMPTSALVSV